jgi:hypothetical protein
MEGNKENKLTKTVRTYNDKSVHKVMDVVTSSTIREIVKISNEKGIKKEDIVSLLRESNQFILVFYRALI